MRKKRTRKVMRRWAWCRVRTRSGSGPASGFSPRVSPMRPGRTPSVPATAAAAAPPSPSATAAERLVDLANESGGNDNITAVVLDVLIADPADLTGSVAAAD